MSASCIHISQREEPITFLLVPLNRSSSANTNMKYQRMLLREVSAKLTLKFKVALACSMWRSSCLWRIRVPPISILDMKLALCFLGKKLWLLELAVKCFRVSRGQKIYIYLFFALSYLCKMRKLA